MSGTQDAGGIPTAPEGLPPNPNSSGGQTSPSPSPGAGYAFSPGERPTIAGLPLAGIGRRLLGYLIDGIILSVIYVPISSAFSTTNNVVTTIGGITLTTQVRIVSPIFQLVFLILDLAYFTLLWSRKGASLGQMAVGVRVVDGTTGAAIGQTQALVRAIGYIVSAIPIFIGFIWAFFDARKQGWMDKMANTLVVEARRY
jgi:uncharacterized RDD family membrane protein YckC